MLSGFAEKRDITYPLLSDEGSKVIAELGLLNRHREQQSLHYGLTPNPTHEGIPYPGSFILDEAGIVRERHFEQSYRNRPTAADFLESSFSAESGRAKVRAQAETDELQVSAWLGTDTYFPYQKLQVHLGVQVRPGLHVYGLPIPAGYVPLSVEVAPLEGLEVRALELPAPHSFQLEGLDEQFQIYEGELIGGLPLSINQNVGDVELTLRLRYQACSDRECFAPRTIELRLPIEARENIRD